uniref:Uncharacterized protein n=1 Tax=Graphocephala atropunctata TaxID=36148 RepID=A0A1B6LKP3_9HEMI
MTSKCLFVCLSLSVCVFVCSAKPTIYVKNENDKLEPVLVAVSSTVIPLPVYKVGYEIGVQGPKVPKPAGDLKLITASKKKLTRKNAENPLKALQNKELKEKLKDTL